MVTCDLCNGILIMEAGGKYAKCSECGMLHSIERVKEKMNLMDDVEVIVPNFSKKEKKKKENKEISVNMFDKYLYKEEEESKESDFVISDLNEEHEEIGVILKVMGSCSHIVIPEGYEWLGEYQDGQRVFEHPECVKSVSFSKSLNTLGDYAFSGCSSLEELYIPENIEFLGYSLGSEVGMSHIFEGCTNLKKVVFHEKAWNDYDVCLGLFKNCKNLKEVVLPNTISFIAEGMFENCVNLERIVIPESVGIIGQHAFRNCKKLKEVILPNHDLAIHPSAFSNTLYKAPEKYTNYKELNRCPICHSKLTFWENHCKKCHKSFHFSKRELPWVI